MDRFLELIGWRRADNPPQLSRQRIAAAVLAGAATLVVIVLLATWLF